MANQSVWYYTKLPKDVVDIIERDLTENFDPQMEENQFNTPDIAKVSSMDGIMMLVFKHNTNQ